MPGSQFRIPAGKCIPWLYSPPSSVPTYFHIPRRTPASCPIPPRPLQARPLSGSRPRGGASGLALAMDPDVLIRILCHRADHAASKFLKKE